MHLFRYSDWLQGQSGRRQDAQPLFSPSTMTSIDRDRQQKSTAMALRKSLWILLGSLSLVLGVIGIILPGLPGTLFVLFAAWCFAKGSERCYQALLQHPWTGPSIQSWQQYRAMPRKAKKLAYLMLALGWLVGLWMLPNIWACLAYSLVLMGVSGYLASIPLLEEVQQHRTPQPSL
ncbi:YbaN family protein [Balneatrix alpica]|uniref:YbaN family protein n=1 Tax=Balneatrix alpica TaxID=75684 RepID=UPI00273843A5|nr:YbaN family protein [Balneatrix alpica]